MTEVVVFHHAQGLTPGLVAFADDLRAAGHTVHAPDLFDGRLPGSIESGLAYVRDLGGMPAILEKARDAVTCLPEDVVYLGFSLGVVAAQYLTQTRPSARGAVFAYSCVPVAEFGTWPAGVPAQIHGGADDPFFAEEGDLDAARALAAQAPGVEVFTYPTDQHYFADSSLPSYRPELAALLTERVLTFLGTR